MARLDVPSALEHQDLAVGVLLGQLVGEDRTAGAAADDADVGLDLLDPDVLGPIDLQRVRTRLGHVEILDAGALAERLVADRLERPRIAVVADEAQLLADPDHDLRQVLEQRRPDAAAS